MQPFHSPGTEVSDLVRRDQYNGDLHFDLGNMMACEQGPIDRERFEREPDAACLELATQITQSLVAQLFQLPSEAAPVRSAPSPCYLHAVSSRSFCGDSFAREAAGMNSILCAERHLRLGRP